MTGFLKRCTQLLIALFLPAIIMPVLAQTELVNVVMEAEPNNLDPGQYNGVNSERVIRRVFEGLTAVEAGGTEIIPWLATSWDISDDGTEYIFNLRDDVTFHDGTPFNAEAVKFSIERTIKEDHPFFETGQWSYAPVWFSAVDYVEPIDEYTVRVKLTRPDPAFLAKLTLPSSLIVSSAAVSEDPAGFPRAPVGTGPYSFERWESGNRIVLERYDNYWGEEAIPETLVYQWMPEDQARVAALITGQADVIVPVPSDYLPQLQSNDSVNILQQPGIHTWYIGLNTERVPTNDVKVRKALAYAIDREQIVKNILNEAAIVADSPLVPDSWAYEPEVTKYEYDPEKARQLLREAGWEDTDGDGIVDKDGQPMVLSFWIPASGSGMQKPVEMSTFIANQWRDIGVQAETQVLEWGSYLQSLRNGEFHAFANSFMPETVDPDVTFSFLYDSSAIPSPNRMRFSNERVDELIELARQTTDREERAQYYSEALKIVTDQVPTIFIDHDIQTVATSADIEGLQLHTTYDVGVDTVRRK